MSDVPILQSGDVIHMVSTLISEKAIREMISMYAARGIKVEWTKFTGAGETRIVSIIRGKDPVGLMAQMQPRVR